MLQYLPLHQLIPYERNNKIHNKDQIKKIAKSIKELGFRSPIIVDENFVILAGHGRLAAAQYLGLTEVPVIQYTDLTEEQKKKYRLLDNRLADLSEYDLENLRLELQDLDDIRLTDLFDDFDLGLGEEEERDETTEDDAPAPDEEIRVQDGDIFELAGSAGLHYLVCGDSTKIETYTLLKENIGAEADMLFTDPPYNVNYKGQGKNTSNCILNDRMSNDRFALFLTDSFSAMSVMLKPTAPLYVFHSHKTQREFQTAMETNGIEIISQLIWNKPSINHVGAKYKAKHEPFFYAKYKKQEIPRYGDEMFEESVRTTPNVEQLSDKKLLELIRHSTKAEQEGKTTIRSMKRHNVQDYVHPTQKPVELVERAILNSSKEGDFVLEPFGGSGTTLIAAEKTGRRCGVIELDPRYVQVILKRYHQQTQKTIRCLNRTISNFIYG